MYRSKFNYSPFRKAERYAGTLAKTFSGEVPEKSVEYLDQQIERCFLLRYVGRTTEFTAVRAM
jgi:hypothetical protein